MSTTYYVPSDAGTLSSVKGSVLATGVALFFLFIVNFLFQILVTFVLNREEKQRNKIKRKLLQTSQVMYLYVLATMFSIYPPFFYGAHSTVFAWLTLIVMIILHAFCIIEKSCKERSLWSYFYFIYHFLIFFWILIALGVGFTWAGKQDAVEGEN